MKKTITLLVVVVLLFYVLIQHTGPYSGVYDYSKNSNIVLRINNNNTFILYNAVGKTSEFIKGKYTVNNNNIALVPDEENIDQGFKGTLIGKIEGSAIEMTTLKGEFIKR